MKVIILLACLFLTALGIYLYVAIQSDNFGREYFDAPAPSPSIDILAPSPSPSIVDVIMDANTGQLSPSPGPSTILYKPPAPAPSSDSYFAPAPSSDSYFAPASSPYSTPSPTPYNNGAPGTNGPSGSPGTNGTDGTSGAPGTNGANGTSGAPGTNGSNGSNGTSGAPGTNGSNGSNGTSGAPGANGTNGSNGTSGAPGANGGTSGSNGNNGSGGKTGGGPGTYYQNEKKDRWLDGTQSADYLKNKDKTDSIYDVNKVPFGKGEIGDLVSGGGGGATASNSSTLLNGGTQTANSLASATSDYKSDGKGQTCPDTLAYKDGKYTLYFKSDPSKSPITFNTMDEYGKYNQEQRKSGNNCPVLFVRQEFDAQGNAIMRTAQAPFVNGKPQWVDASRENPPYNKDNYPGFDPTGLYNGVRTVLDEIHDITEKRPVSDNPMDPNWGGVLHTQMAVDSGKYDGNQVTKPLFSKPLRDPNARPVIA